MFKGHSTGEYGSHDGNAIFTESDGFSESTALAEEQLKNAVDEAENNYDRANELLGKASQDPTADLDAANALKEQRHQELIKATEAYADFLEGKNQTH